MGCVPFHIGLLLWESARCESLSHAYGVPAPFHKGAFLSGIDTASKDEPPESICFPGVVLLVQGG